MTTGGAVEHLRGPASAFFLLMREERTGGEQRNEGEKRREGGRRGDCERKTERVRVCLCLNDYVLMHSIFLQSMYFGNMVSI